MLADCAGVYQILNTLNGKRYVGSAVNIARRWTVHVHRLRRGKHHSRPLQNAYNKYGLAAFRLEVLHVTPRAEMLISLEDRYLDELRPEYNVAPNAGSCLGRPSPMRGRKHSVEARAKIAASLTGHPCPTETRNKLSAANIGKTMSIESRQRISLAGMSRTMSAEARAKIGNAQRGKIVSAETREKISEAGRRRPPMSDATRAKMGAFHRGCKRSPETRAKMVAAWAVRRSQQTARN